MGEDLLIKGAPRVMNRTSIKSRAGLQALPETLHTPIRGKIVYALLRC